MAPKLHISAGELCLFPDTRGISGREIRRWDLVPFPAVYHGRPRTRQPELLEEKYGAEPRGAGEGARGARRSPAGRVGGRAPRGAAGICVVGSGGPRRAAARRRAAGSDDFLSSVEDRRRRSSCPARPAQLSALQPKVGERAKAAFPQSRPRRALPAEPPVPVPLQRRHGAGSIPSCARPPCREDRGAAAPCRAPG